MNELELNYGVFESIKHIDEYDKELVCKKIKRVLEYKRWKKLKIRFSFS